MFHTDRVSRSRFAIACFALCCVRPVAVIRADEPTLEEPTFAETFTPDTMRVDYYHSGNASEEHIALERVVSDGPWAGSRQQLIDRLNRGKYLCEVRDLSSNWLIFSRGYCSVYGEWETTTPARTQWGTFHESLRFPWPQQSIQVSIKKRVRGIWREIWTEAIDPGSRFVNPAVRPAAGPTWTVVEHGPPHQKVDLVILGDGYAAADTEKFHAQVHQLTNHLFEHEPFLSRREDFNVRAVDLLAATSGISRPRAGKFHRSPISAEYNTFDSERYVLTFDNRALRDAAASVPYDCLIILVNERKYGGGGIYGDQTTVAAGNAFAGYLFVHEFGHHFAGLADEYYTSSVAYDTTAPVIEPWEPNVTALQDPAQLKWKSLIPEETPLPTPWNKQQYDKSSKRIQAKRAELRAQGADEAELEALFTAERERLTNLLNNEKFTGRVGAFEGAGYQSKGLFRPSPDCIMFTRNEVGFCAVCQQAIQQTIDQHCDRN